MNLPLLTVTFALAGDWAAANATDHGAMQQRRQVRIAQQSRGTGR